MRYTVLGLQTAAVGVHIAVHTEREVGSGLNRKGIQTVSVRIREPRIVVHVHTGVLIEEELNGAVLRNGGLADGVAGVAVLRVIFAILVAGELAVDRETERGGFFSVDRGDRAVADDEIIALAVLREVLTEGELVVLHEHVQRGNAVCDIISVAIAFGEIAGDFHAGRNHDKHIFCLHGNGRVDRLGLFHRDCDGVGHGSAVLSGHSKRPDAVLTLGRAGKRGLAVGKCDLEAVCRDLCACRERYGEAVFSRTGCCLNACDLDGRNTRVRGLRVRVDHSKNELVFRRFCLAVACFEDERIRTGSAGRICVGGRYIERILGITPDAVGELIVGVLVLKDLRHIKLIAFAKVDRGRSRGDYAVLQPGGMVRLGRHTQLVDPDVGGVGLVRQRNDRDQTAGKIGIDDGNILRVRGVHCFCSSVGRREGIYGGICRIVGYLNLELNPGCARNDSIRRSQHIAARCLMQRKAARCRILQACPEHGERNRPQWGRLRCASAGHGDGIRCGGRAVLGGNGERPDIAVGCGSGDAGLFIGENDLEAVCRNLGVRLQLDRVGCLTGLRGRGVRDGNGGHACVRGLRRFRDGHSDGVGHSGAVLSGHGEAPDAAFALGRAYGDAGLVVGERNNKAVCRDSRAVGYSDGVGVVFTRGCLDICDLDGRNACVRGLSCAEHHVDGVSALAVARFIHGGPAVVCTDDGDDAAICDGDQGRAGIFAARSLRAEIGADLIVLVCRRRCDEQRGRAFRHSQGVGEGVAAELGRQLTGAERERLEAGIGIVPVAAEIDAIIAGVHDADLIARMERALCNGKFTKAKVCEPVVERAHPAGHRAALLLLEVVNGGDVVAFRADDGVAIQCFHNAAHHGRFASQLDPGVGQRAFPDSALRLRERGVLHDHAGHAGQRQNADIRHIRAALGGVVLHIGQRQCVAAGSELLFDAAALLTADSVGQRFRAAAVFCERDGQFVIAVFRGNAVAEAQNGGCAQRKGKRGRGAGLVLILVAAFKAVQIGIVDPGVIAVVGNADRGDSLLGVGDVAEAVVVPDRVGFAADGAFVGLIAGEDLLGAVLGRMALGGNDVFLRF